MECELTEKSVASSWSGVCDGHIALRTEIIGGCTMCNGDCIDILPQFPRFDLILVDPPYKVTSRGGYTSAGGMMLDDKVRKGKIFEENSIEINNWLPLLYDSLKDGGHCYIFTNNKNITKFLKAVDDSKFHLVKNLIWMKDNKIMSQAYMSQFEYILFLRKGKFVRINNCGTSDILQFNNPKNKSHPTEKPVDLLEVLINNSSNKGDTVLDCFMGSGSTGVAGRNLGRKFVGIEKDIKYFDIACKRAEQKCHAKHINLF